MAAEPVKTKYMKITNRTARQLQRILAGVIAAFLGLSALAQLPVPPPPPVVVDLFWTGGTDFTPTNAVSGEWTTNCCPPLLNWSDTPTSSGNFSWTNGDIAHFLDPIGVTVTLTSDITAAAINFGSGAGPFLIQTNGHILILDGAGITNSSGTMQTFDNTGGINFLNGASASNVTIINSGTFSFAEFSGTSTAASATITNAGAGSFVAFFGNSSGGNATLINANGTAFIDISGLALPGTTVGSIAGNGSLFLGDKNLTVGGNQTSTIFSGVIQDGGGFGGAGGSLTKVGTGTLTLTGANTYTGITTINAGVLSISSDANLGTVPTSDNYLANQLTFNSGTLQVTASFDLDANRGITLLSGGGTIRVTAANILSYDGVITGAGSLTKTDTGTLVLSGMNTYTGSTIVDAGSLLVDGSIGAGPTSVNAGGLLGGGGTIGGDVTNGGIVSPGHSPGMLGTLTVNGNYTQTTGGTLRIEVAGLGPSAHDLLAVGGHASLAGTLQLIRLGNFQLQVGDKIKFLTAPGGVSGTFSTIVNPFVSNTLVLAEIIYLPTGVQLEGTQGSFTEVACNPNTLAVAKALNSAVGDPRAAGLIEFLDTQPRSDLCPELELISPEELAAMFNIGVSLANIQSVNLERRMEDIRAGSTGFSARGFSIDGRVPDSSPGLAGPSGPEGKSGPSVMQPTPQNRWGVFVTGLGEFTSVDDTSIAPGYDFSTGGLTFGVDYRVSPNFAIGLTGGYAHTNANLVNNGSLDVNGGTIGAYATGFGGGFYLDAAAFGVFNGYDSHRTALLGTASGNTDGRDFNALVQGGYDWKTGGLTIGPTVSYQYTYVEFDSFTEHGSLAPLSFGDQNTHSSRTALGAKASYDWHVGHVVVKPEIRASWQHEFGDRDYSIVSRFANGAGNSFTVTGPEIGRDSLLIGAGAAVLLNERVSIYAYYDGELARTNYSSHNVSAGLRVTF
jgi:autotransporter-associated beta strand protein